MQVFLKVCPRCGYVQKYSVAVLCEPDSAPDFATKCPACGWLQSPYGRLTEDDTEEWTTSEPDAAAILKRIGEHLEPGEVEKIIAPAAPGPKKPKK